MILAIDNTTFPIPSWNELTGKQFTGIIRMAKKYRQINELMLRILLFLTGLRPKYMKYTDIPADSIFTLIHKKKQFNVAASDLAFAAEKLRNQFLSEDIYNEQARIYLNYNIYKNLIPYFFIGRFRLVRLYGPADALTNITLEEYKHTETYFSRYEKTRDERYLHRLAAVLYRRRSFKSYFKPINDKRRIFNDILIDKQAKRLVHVNKLILEAVLIWYSGCRKFIHNMFPSVFKGPGTRDDPFKALSYLEIALAGGIVNAEKARKALLYEALIDLERKALEGEEIKKHRKHGIR